MTATGLNVLINRFVGSDTYAAFNNTNSFLGVGDSQTPFSSEQTDLQADPVRKLRKPMDEGYPKIDGRKVIFQSTFPAGEATFPWFEWGIFNKATEGQMFNRAQYYLGTKLIHQRWILQVELIFSIGG